MDDETGVFRLTDVRLSVGEGRIAFETKNRPAIDRHWQARLADNPRLWNGPAFLFEDVCLERGVLTGTGRRTDFATFLYWRDNGRPRAVTHITGTSLPVMADGALFAVRMAAHTVNAGQVYFPAGSLDEDDLDGGLFDVTGNIARELAEETGFVFREAEAETGFAGLRDNGAIYLTRRNRLAFGFDEGEERLRRHQADTGDDEIAGAIAVRADGAGRDALKPHASRLADWHFENAAFGCNAKS